METIEIGKFIQYINTIKKPPKYIRPAKVKGGKNSVYP
jgi:hypothetical protein